MSEAVATHHRRLREDCLGLTALVPGLATDDPETRHTSISPERVELILRRHLEAAVARHVAALDGAG